MPHPGPAASSQPRTLRSIAVGKAESKNLTTEAPLPVPVPTPYTDDANQAKLPAGQDKPSPSTTPFVLKP
jgi:hypothetical protein